MEFNMKILLTDDHSVVRAGIKSIISEKIKNCHFGEAGNAADTLRLLKESKWDILVLDLNLPDRSGLDILKGIKSINSDMGILVLSMYPEEQFAQRILKAGADGYVNKDSAPDELVEAILLIQSGKKYISPAVGQLLANSLNEKAEFSHKKLSDREYQVMLLIAQGKSLTEIAQELFISVKTVHTYKNNIYQKMSFKSNSEIVHYVNHHKLLLEFNSFV
jgi:two-component system, NarL family, invasion response regulator UvrY